MALTATISLVAAQPAEAIAELQSSNGANTFLNPYNASGMGPKIAANTWVDVSCKLYAPQIKSANPDGYWYRIASAPWNNAYYAVANTFRNGDIPGQPPYIHNTDWAVPDCSAAPAPPPPPPAPPPGSPPADRDGDGFSPPADCMDTNSTVWPGAPEIPANGLDDDCAGGDRPGKVLAVVSSEWAVKRSAVRVVRLQVRDAPPFAQVEVRCRGRRCRFGRRGTAVDQTGAARLGRLIRRRMRPGTTLEVRITAPNMIGKVVRYRIRRGRVPRGRTLCLSPGATKPSQC